MLRAVLENNLHRGALPVKLWYSGSYYRYERPQKAATGTSRRSGPRSWAPRTPPATPSSSSWPSTRTARSASTGVRVLLNTLGSHESRPAYRDALQAFLRGLDLDEETARRVEINPLRVLDDKRPEIQKALTEAPLITDFLSPADRAHHDAVRSLLTAAGVAFEDDPRLVRGLDYYTRTLFEFVHDGLGSQSAVGGGGRYDGLSELIGGPALPGDRLGAGCRPHAAGHGGRRAATAGRHRRPGVRRPASATEAATWAFGLVTSLRREGVAADVATGGRGLKGP